MECDIRSKSELLSNLQNNDPTPPYITHETKICRMDESKVTDLVGEIISKKTNHKELRSFIRKIRVLQTHDFELVYRSVF